MISMCRYKVALNDFLPHSKRLITQCNAFYLHGVETILQLYISFLKINAYVTGFELCWQKNSGYLYYKAITYQSVPSEAQTKYFFISLK